MDREDCWMTFSEALESYLSYRAARAQVGEGANRRDYEDNMRTAAAHMDALTAPSQSAA